MNYIETKHTSYLSRLGDSIKGIFFGFLLIIGSIILLWWNEGRTIDISTGLKEAQQNIVNGKNDKIDSNLNNKIVYNNGKATTDDILNDTTFGIKRNAIKLTRHVEVYQWQENSTTHTKEHLGGSKTTTTTYTYKKVRSKDLIKSNEFKQLQEHTNPSIWKYNNKTITAQNVYIGKLKLGQSFVSQINKNEPIKISEQGFKNIKITTQNTGFTLNGNILYYGSGNINNPKIGDYKIYFTEVKPTIVSTIGLQQDGILKPYTTKRETEVSLLEYGTIPKKEMFKHAQTRNKYIAWILRGLGLMFMFIGFKLIFGFIVTLGKIIPIFGSILDWGTGLISFILTLILGFGVIIIAWFWVRPWLSIGLIVIVSTIIWFIFNKKKNTNNDIAKF